MNLVNLLIIQNGSAPYGHRHVQKLIVIIEHGAFHIDSRKQVRCPIPSSKIPAATFGHFEYCPLPGITHELFWYHQAAMVW